MSDDKDRFRALEGTHRVHHTAFGSIIERACGFVQYQYFGIMIERSGNPNTLTLST